MKKATIVNREGWNEVGAVRDDRIFEVKSTYILQPGPASLTEGVRQLHERFSAIHDANSTVTGPGKSPAACASPRSLTTALRPRSP